MGRVQVVCGDDRRRTLTIREFTLLTLLLLIHCVMLDYAPNFQLLLLLLLSPFSCPLLNSITTLGPCLSARHVGYRRRANL